MVNLSFLDGTKVIDIPNDSCGRIIGKGGATIKQMESQSGAKIRMKSESAPGSSTKELTLEGPPECIAAAQVLIMDKVNEKQRLTGPFKGDAPTGPQHAARFHPYQSAVRNAAGSQPPGFLAAAPAAAGFGHPVGPPPAAPLYGYVPGANGGNGGLPAADFSPAGGASTSNP
ncbi:hypothetical protein T484DRAFT_1838399 [Baffinella frigidus]|nr:hypothetical protein T484DRAFT_1838399 [Cryptophyta sp. CCMP2293]